MNDEQQEFLEKLALRIPRLFEVIRQGNIHSEYIIGVRRVGKRLVRLKLVVEVVESDVNPLATHGMHLSMKSHTSTEEEVVPAPASRRRRSRKR